MRASGDAGDDIVAMLYWTGSRYWDGFGGLDKRFCVGRGGAES